MSKNPFDKSMFERIDLQQISSFLLYGSDSLLKEELLKEKSYKVVSYKERLAEVKLLAINSIDSFVNENGAYSEVEDTLDDVLDLYEEICTERGIKLGAKLMLQLLHAEDNSMP